MQGNLKHDDEDVASDGDDNSDAYRDSDNVYLLFNNEKHILSSFIKTKAHPKDVTRGFFHHRHTTYSRVPTCYASVIDWSFDNIEKLNDNFDFYIYILQTIKTIVKNNAYIDDFGNLVGEEALLLRWIINNHPNKSEKGREYMRTFVRNNHIFDDGKLVHTIFKLLPIDDFTSKIKNVYGVLDSSDFRPKDD